MGNLIQLQKNFQKLANKKYLEELLFTEIKRYENIFVNLQKKQLSSGEDNEGDLFGTYTHATEEIARLENPRKPKTAGEPYNFEYTGGLFDGMELQFRDNEAFFWSTDNKTKELVVKYDGLFGLQEDNLRKVIQQIIAPAVILQIRKTLGL